MISQETMSTRKRGHVLESEQEHPIPGLLEAHVASRSLQERSGVRLVV